VLSGAAMKEKRPVFTADCEHVVDFDEIWFTYYVRFADAVQMEKLTALADTVEKLDEKEFVIGKMGRRALADLWEKLGVTPVSVIRILE